ncbi:Gfo/Idh/MocA family oxidoreductase [Nocardioides sp. NPDC126508]
MTTNSDPIRWGILGTGRIAHSLATDLMLVPDGRLVAVGSRSKESAETFAKEYAANNPVRAHGSYEELAADEDVDVVYIASPHSHHLEHATLVLEAGKHVLCEKALTLNAADSQTMVDLATSKKLFLMEAMWMATNPIIRRLVADVRSGRFGVPRHVHAELGFVADPERHQRLLDPALGASALLDMGIYPLTFAHLLFGEARSLTAQANIGTGADGGTFDLDLVMTGKYAGNELSTMVSSVTSYSSRAAAIATDQGRIELTDFHHPSSAVFKPANGDEPVEIVGDEPVVGAGYGNEIAEVQRCLREGLLESPLVPHSQTLSLMRQMDMIRESIGARFAGES